MWITLKIPPLVHFRQGNDSLSIQTHLQNKLNTCGSTLQLRNDHNPHRETQLQGEPLQYTLLVVLVKYALNPV